MFLFLWNNAIIRFSSLYSDPLNVHYDDSGKALVCANFGILNSAVFASHLSLKKALRALTTACWKKKSLEQCLHFGNVHRRNLAASCFAIKLKCALQQRPCDASQS